MYEYWCNQFDNSSHCFLCSLTNFLSCVWIVGNIDAFSSKFPRPADTIAVDRSQEDDPIPKASFKALLLERKFF